MIDAAAGGIIIHIARATIQQQWQLPKSHNVWRLLQSHVNTVE
jgi:hypothetical protein